MIRVAAWFSVAIGSVFLVVGRFGQQCATCDLANIGRPYSAWLAVLGILFLFALQIAHRRHWWPILGATAFVAIAASGGDRVPDALSCGPEPSGRRLRIVTFNAWAQNRSPAAAAAWIRTQNPDVVVIVEVKGASAALPTMLADILPYQLSCAVRIPCSTRILSRIRPDMVLPMARGDVENRKALSSVAITVPASGGARATIVAVHLSRPLPLGRQRAELIELRVRLRTFDPQTLIVAGDFNATRDNAALVAFARDLDIASVPSGPTWPTEAVHIGMPSVLAIDHILVGRRFRSLLGETGPVIGSDHRPIAATLCLATA